ncbi:hypothetical protein BN2476_140045 [Paraburkholderia piptadeniae]|uniref:Uncharacterized protein n=1 Tax=Paraburkholderia piptadeniae TaxID=1701573 RepID=A0A1N7RT63_9BURK|nr:hypothetical protein BN2476_140045 [Paraburkholderia piptadeniae]
MNRARDDQVADPACVWYREFVRNTFNGETFATAGDVVVLSRDVRPDIRHRLSHLFSPVIVTLCAPRYTPLKTCRE